jgi:carbon monoxide dehydrogenase subunit G
MAARAWPHGRERRLEIEQSFTVPFTADQVWRCFHDIEAIVACLPGAALSAPPSDAHLLLSMTVRLGPIVATFAGQAVMTLDEAARRGSIAGGGSDRKSGSRIKGEASFVLHAQGTPANSTRIDVRVDYALAGSLAQFSRGGIMRELAQQLTSQFSGNLQSRLAAVQVEAASAPAPAPPLPPPPPAASPARAAPLDLGRMLWPMLIARLQRWFRVPARRLSDAQSRDD